MSVNKNGIGPYQPAAGGRQSGGVRHALRPLMTFLTLCSLVLVLLPFSTTPGLAGAGGTPSATPTAIPTPVSKQVPTVMPPVSKKELAVYTDYVGRLGQYSVVYDGCSGSPLLDCNGNQIVWLSGDANQLQSYAGQYVSVRTQTDVCGYGIAGQPLYGPVVTQIQTIQNPCTVPVQVTSVYTTDNGGTPKTVFKPGDILGMRIYVSNMTAGQASITLSWDVYDPSGNKVPQLSYDNWQTTVNPGTYWWGIGPTIPTTAVRGTYTFRGTGVYNGVTSMRSTQFIVRKTEADFDGDGKADMAIFRPSWGAWFILRSDSNWTTYIAKGWGTNGDIPLAGDFDGDGKADMAIFRPSWGAWFVLLSGSNWTTYIAKGWGTNGDIPLAGDFDGDGKADMAVFRPSWGTWFVLLSGSNYTTSIAKGWGTNGDIPLAGDFDGDGKADMVVYRPAIITSWYYEPGVWYVLTSSSGYTGYVAYVWGDVGDKPVPGYYDGDGKTDCAVYHAPNYGAWYVLTSSSGYTSYLAYGWGIWSDTPVLGDYDGDGKTDCAVYRPSLGTWFILLSGSNYTTSIAKGWGTSGDIPVGQ